MSDGLVFLLHNAAERKYVAELARALSPLSVIATEFPEQGELMRIGAGATSVLIWNGAAVQAQRFVEAQPKGAFAAVLALTTEPAPPTMLARAEFVRSQNNIAADAEALRAVVLDLQARQQQRAIENAHRARRNSMVSPGQNEPAAPEMRRTPAVVRSAVSLTTTLAIVGAGAWYISKMESAQAVAMDNSEGSQGGAVAAPVERLAQTAAPANEQLDVGLDAFQADPHAPAVTQLASLDAGPVFKPFAAIVAPPLLSEPGAATLAPAYDAASPDAPFAPSAVIEAPPMLEAPTVASLGGVLASSPAMPAPDANQATQPAFVTASAEPQASTGLFGVLLASAEDAAPLLQDVALKSNKLLPPGLF